MKKIHRAPRNTILPSIGFLIPVLLLVGSYLYMAATYHKGWLLDTVVHENGRYTLLQTILYFRHFSWEILGKATYCMFLVGVFFYYGNPVKRNSVARSIGICKWKIILGAILTASIVAMALLMAARQVGWQEMLFGFLQYRTNEKSALEFGSHWRNHFLSNVALFSCSGFCIWAYRTLIQERAWIMRRSRVFFGAGLVFVGLTLIFGFNRKQFEAASYLGHQLREIIGTDLSITMLLAISLLLYLENKYDSAEEIVDCSKIVRKRFLAAFCWITPVVLSTAYLAFKISNLNIAVELAKVSKTSNHSILGTFCWHFYEHSLDYLFVIVTVYWLYLWLLKTESKNQTA
jgi:hypothetical protein